MDSPDPSPSAFDEFLDLRFRGVTIDPEAFVAAHPELTEAERDQVRRLGRGRPHGETSSPTQPSAPPSAARESPPLARLGGYRLGRRIGAGGMGAVFLAEDEALGRPVAVKILGPDLLGTGERAERFLREARAVAKLKHPHIVHVYAAGEQDGFRYMAMEYVPGSNLHEIIADAAARGARVPVADAVRWATEIAHALHAAHRASIVHRDVKPSNIRVTEGGRAVLLDFGLVQEEGAATLTDSGAFRGSPQYASPEQVGLAGVAIDARTDVYSLGATLYEALTGVAPFRGETRDQLFHHILSRDPVPPRRLDPSIPKDLETVVLAALEKEPARRYATAAALAADLEAVRDGRPISVRPISAAGRAIRWARRQPMKAALAATAVLALIAAAVLGGFVLSNLDRIDRAAAAEKAARLASLLERGFIESGDEGDPKRAEPIFLEALSVDPSSDDARAGLALARMAARDFAATLAGLETPAQQGAETWRALIRAETFERMGRRPDADAILKDLAPASTSLDFFVLGMLKLDDFHRGRTASAGHAFEHLRRAILSSPTAKAIYHHEFGHAAWHAKRHKEAREEADIIRQLFPDSPERRYAIARTLQDADPAKSLEAYAEAARMPLRGSNPCRTIATKLAQSGQPEMVGLADDLVRDLVARDPDNATLHAARGSVAFAKNDVAGAMAAFQEAIRLDPACFSAQRALAEACLVQRDYAAAVGPAREAVRLQPQDAIAWNVLGSALTDPKDLDEAIDCFEKSVALVPDYPHTLCNLGRALLQRGEFARGLELLIKGDAKAAQDPKWKYPSKTWVQYAKHLVALEKRFEDFRRGGEPPSIEDRIRFANQICRSKKLYAEAAKLFDESFQIDAELATQPTPHYRLFAAMAALIAGSGGGNDAPADEVGARPGCGRGRALGLPRSWPSSRRRRARSRRPWSRAARPSGRRSPRSRRRAARSPRGSPTPSPPSGPRSGPAATRWLARRPRRRPSRDRSARRAPPNTAGARASPCAHGHATGLATLDADRAPGHATGLAALDADRAPVAIGAQCASERREARAAARTEDRLLERSARLSDAKRAPQREPRTACWSAVRV